jgi:hypothetical protein
MLENMLLNLVLRIHLLMIVLNELVMKNIEGLPQILLKVVLEN